MNKLMKSLHNYFIMISIRVILAVFILLLICCPLYSQSLGSALRINAGLQSGATNFKSSGEQWVSLDENPFYIAPFATIGLESDDGPWGFNFSLSAPLRRNSYRDIDQSNIITEIPYWDYSFRSVSIDADVTYLVGNRFRVFAGPFIQLLHSSKRSLNRYSEAVDYNSSFTGVNAGVNLTLDRIVIGVFFASSLRRVDIYTSSMTHRSAQLRLGYVVVK